MRFLWNRPSRRIFWHRASESSSLGSEHAGVDSAADYFAYGKDYCTVPAIKYEILQIPSLDLGISAQWNRGTSSNI